MRNEFQRRILSTERDYYIRLLLSHNSWQSVCFSALLASEILIGAVIAFALIWVVVSNTAAWWPALIQFVTVLPQYLILGVGVMAVQLVAALAAKWGQMQRWSGRTISLTVHLPLTIFVFGLVTRKYLQYLAAAPSSVQDSAGQVLVENIILVTPTALMMLFLASAALTFCLWDIWWMILLLILEKKGDVDVWQLIADANKKQPARIVAEYQYSLKLRKEAAWEKKHRWLFHSRQTTKPHNHQQKGNTWPVHPVGIILVVIFAVVGTIWWKETKMPDAPELTAAAMPKSVLSFWFEGTPRETEIIMSLVEIYNQNPVAGTLIQAHHVPRLNEAVVKASIAGTLPDILLADESLAEKVVYLSRESDHHPRVALPVWDQVPWRPNLRVVIVANGVNYAASAGFAEYIIHHLTESQETASEAEIDSTR